MNSLVKRFLPVSVLGIAASVIAYAGIWQWGFCRIEVPPGHSLLIRYKGPWPIGGSSKAPDGTLVKTDTSGNPTQVGILEVMPGPGRHFYSPLEFETELVPDIVVPPGKLGVVTSKMGKSLPSGTFLADQEGFRGIKRKVLTPGLYRLNKYAFDVRLVDVDACVETKTKLARKSEDPTLIPPGYVGVVTNKTDDPRMKAVQGIQDQVLQPGIYFLNPEEKRIDVISVGFNETTLTVETDVQATKAAQEAADASNRDPRGDRLGKYTLAEPVYKPNKGIEFPSNDGFLIHLDFTAIWGIIPSQAPEVVKAFGTLPDVEQKVILPQIGSICRMHGSKRGAVDLLVGEKRELFQTETSEELESVLASKKLSLLFGLTRHIYVPRQVREPIQRANIADELTKTREQEQMTAKAQASLTEAKAKVTLEERRTLAETLKLVAQLEAEGEKKAQEVKATTEKIKAEVDAKTASIEAQTTKVIGEANAKKTELSRQAEADRFRQYVNALGSPDAYNKYVFAEGLPSDMKLGIFYAGPGTFWTDLKGLEPTLLGKLVSETQKPTTQAATTTASGSPDPSGTQ